MSVASGALERGARNLLVSCAGARPGESLLILHEEAGSTYVDPALAVAVADMAERLGLVVRLMEVRFDPDACTLSPEQREAVCASDHALFLCRLGDQLRFKEMPENCRPIVSYALDVEALASDFGGACHQAFIELKSAFNDLLLGAGRIRVTCPRGTNYEGAWAPIADSAPADVTVKRFPMCVFAPIPAARFSGVVAVSHLLVGTGSRYYAPYGLRLNADLSVEIEKGRIRAWRGDPEEARRAEAHYQHVADHFGIDRDAVHSWHAGIHPGCAYPGSAHDNYERWTNSAFGNPRLLHFHTCGDYPPGEICWNVIDPTIEVDGARVWSEGRILIDAVPGAGAILGRHPEVCALFDRPERRIGLPCGA